MAGGMNFFALRACARFASIRLWATLKVLHARENPPLGSFLDFQQLRIAGIRSSQPSALDCPVHRFNARTDRSRKT